MFLQSQDEGVGRHVPAPVREDTGKSVPHLLKLASHYTRDKQYPDCDEITRISDEDGCPVVDGSRQVPLRMDQESLHVPPLSLTQLPSLQGCLGKLDVL